MHPLGAVLMFSCLDKINFELPGVRKLSKKYDRTFYIIVNKTHLQALVVQLRIDGNVAYRVGRNLALGSTYNNILLYNL
jgi:hypothetical protein